MRVRVTMLERAVGDLTASPGDIVEVDYELGEALLTEGCAVAVISPHGGEWHVNPVCQLMEMPDASENDHARCGRFRRQSG